MALDPRVNTTQNQTTGPGVNYWQPGDRGVVVGNGTVDASLVYFNPKHDNEAESSILASLYANARIYPESEVHGTPTMRTALFKNSYQPNTRYKWRLPMTIKVAVMLQKYMGAADGAWISDAAVDVSPNKNLSGVFDNNVTSVPDFIEDRDWENGANAPIYRDRNSLFYPALQTIYPDDTSGLNSLINSKACATLEVICAEVWRELVGNGKLNADQFLQRSDELITELSTGLFDGRYVIVPRTYYTSRDQTNGYSWSTDVVIYMETMKLVGSYTIVARRREDLVEA